MNLDNYFENHNGLGILSTADKEGVPNAAIYARPHIQDDRAIFLAAPSQTLQNLEQNPNAHYLFKQDGSGYEGVRLQLQLINTDKDQDRANSLRCRHEVNHDVEITVLEFQIMQTLALVGR